MRGVLGRALRVCLDTCLVAACVALESFAFDFRPTLMLGGEAATWVVPAILAVAYSSFLWRRRHPVVVYAIVWCTGLVLAAVFTHFMPFASVLVVLYSVAEHLPRPKSLTAAASYLVFPAFSTYKYTALQGSFDPLSEFFSAMVWAAVTAVVWGVGHSRYATEQATRHHGKQLLAAQESARTTERARIARELHDSVAHSVSAIVLQAAGAKAVYGANRSPRPSARGATPQDDAGVREAAPPDAAVRRSDVADPIEGALASIEEAGAEAMRELHRMVGLLRDDKGDEAETASVGGLRRSAALGLGDAGSDDAETRMHSLDEVAGLVERTRGAGIDIAYTQAGERGVLDGSVEHTAYRVVQEALANAMKHSGPGAHVQVRFSWRPEHVAIAISTSGGRPIDALRASGGRGLVGLAERVQLVGGEFEATKLPHGFVTRATLPTRRQGRGAVPHS